MEGRSKVISNKDHNAGTPVSEKQQGAMQIKLNCFQECSRNKKIKYHGHL